MSTEHLLVKELIVGLVGLAAFSTVQHSPLADQYKAIGGYLITGVTAFWCLRLAGLI